MSLSLGDESDVVLEGGSPKSFAGEGSSADPLSKKRKFEQDTGKKTV